MTDVAKIALIGDEVEITLNALQIIQERQPEKYHYKYDKIIAKIIKAVEKSEQERSNND